MPGDPFDRILIEQTRIIRYDTNKTPFRFKYVERQIERQVGNIGGSTCGPVIEQRLEYRVNIGAPVQSQLLGNLFKGYRGI